MKAKLLHSSNRLAEAEPLMRRALAILGCKPKPDFFLLAKPRATHPDDTSTTGRFARQFNGSRSPWFSAEKFFNEVVAIAQQQRDLLSGEHFSVDGTLIQAWAGHKSFVPKDDDQATGSGGDFKGQRRSKDTHESKTDADARLYRKGNCVIARVPIAHQRAATASA